MNRIKRILLFPLFYISLLIIVVIVIVINSNAKNEFGLPDIIALILSTVGIFVGIKKREVIDITSFESLHNAMTNEMKRINADKSNEKKHLHILSFTPAFGNISTPKLYENSDNPKMTYKYLLENIATKGVDVKIICYDKNKRFEYHNNWANILTKDEKQKQAYINKWEEQAKKIIEVVRSRCGFNSVMEVEHMHPIFFFSSDNILIQYAIRIDSKSESSIVSGTLLNQKNKINFFNQSFDEYYKPSKVVQLYQNYFRNDDKYIEAANDLKRELDGYAAQKNSKINDINILLAYGGGKDSTMLLTFLKYVQELFLKDSKNTFILHIVVHIHPGMTENVLRNIHNVFKKLELDEDCNVKITFKSKSSLISAKQFIKDDFDSGKVLIPEAVKNEFKRELLLLGHLSKGLGRHTFCYTCNIDMIMSIINYTLEQRGKIDYIVTGDSTKEQELYINWLKPIFRLNNSKSFEQNSYNSKSFFDDFIALQNLFRNYIGVGNNKAGNDRKITKFPEILDVHRHVNFSIASSFKGMLEDELGFSFQNDSFNFSETDCFYPSIMAHMAGLKGEEKNNYATYLKLHIDHVSEIMYNKGFPPDLIKQGLKDYIPDISSDKRDQIEKFLLNKFGIDENKLKALIYSPFLDNGKNLQLFIDKYKIDLDSTVIIDYVKSGNSTNEDEKGKIDAFIENWIGLSTKDIKKVMSYSEKPSDTDLLEIIAKNDPYVKEITADDIGSIVISGR